MKMFPNRAVVIGGSIAGLLAARVLSDHFDYVTILERDPLPDAAEYRKGVPQAHHLHTLLVKGQQVLESLFPGITDEMTAAGAPTARWGLDGAFVTTGGWTKSFDARLTSNILGRVSLEWLVRRRVSQIKNITIRTGVDVTALTMDDNRITGVAIASRGTGSIETIRPDLLVDASGRRSKTPEWLKLMGYPVPEQTIVNAHIAYSTRWFELPPDTDFKMLMVAIQPRPKQKLYRGGGIMQVEGNQWVVTLIGANRDYPPTDEQGFLEFAATLPDMAIYNAIKNAKPISPVYHYRNLESQHRHYERLERIPERLVVMGDAFCALNPIYGQGMTTAALEAVELGKLLGQHGTHNLNGFGKKFHKQQAQVISPAWMMATSEDLRYPDVDGQKPDFATRLAHRYFDMVAQTMPYDEVIVMGFMEAMNLLKGPIPAMMHPRVMWRVFKHTLFPPKQASQPAQSTSTGVYKTV